MKPRIAVCKTAKTHRGTATNHHGIGKGKGKIINSFFLIFLLFS